MPARLWKLTAGIARRPVRVLLALLLVALAFGGYRLGSDYWLGRAYHDHLQAERNARRAGLLDEAGRQLAECARLRPAAPELPLEQTLLRAQGGELGDGEEIVKAPLDDADAAVLRDALVRQAERAMERADFPRAYRQLVFCLRLAPNDATVHFLAARCARRGQLYPAAEDHLAACERLTGPTPALRLERALMRVQQGDLGRDEGFLHSLVEQDHPDTVLILEAIVQGYMNTVRFEPALECLAKWIILQPQAVQAYRWRAQLWTRLRRYSDALDDYRRALEIEPRHDPTRLAMAEVYLSFNHRPEAEALLEPVYRRQPNNPKVLIGLAVCRRMEGRPAEAAALLDRVVAQDPQPTLVLVERARVALDLRKPEDAERYLRRALKQDPHNYEVYLSLHRALQGRDPKGAEEALKTYKRLEQEEEELRKTRTELLAKPRDVELRKRVGLLCLQTGRSEEGLYWLEGIVYEHPERRDVHQILADHYTEIGNPDRAAEHRRMARDPLDRK